MKSYDNGKQTIPLDFVKFNTKDVFVVYCPNSDNPCTH